MTNLLPFTSELIYNFDVNYSWVKFCILQDCNLDVPFSV